MRKPILGPAFDPDFTNDSGRVTSYVCELRWYRPRGFAALAKEGDALSRELGSENGSGDAVGRMDSWLDEVEDMLTVWARRVLRNDYVWFGPDNDARSVGFWYATESALEDCDIRLDAGDSVPRGFSGMAAFITDHGNVAIQTFSRGRKCRELLSVV